LTEAYEKGILSLEQIETIHKEYLRYEWPEEIKNMLKEELKSVLSEASHTMVGGVYLNYRLGSYDSMYVGIFEDTYSNHIDYTNNYSDESYFDKETIGEYEFVYKCTCRIRLWKDHEFYLLKDAYEMSLINDEQLELIYREYNKAVWRIRKY
ncbi:MAG: hypothetical protein K2N65_01145, partial [Anaeroplasmataceae bacterium]|nr:hypothetical protein [Anaeroplasmataceae bacterium]